MKLAVSIFASILTVTLYAFFIASPTHASQIDYDWVSGDPGYSYKEEPQPRLRFTPTCTNQKVNVSGNGTLAQDTWVDACMVEKNNWRYGWASQVPGGGSYVIGFGVEEKVYRFDIPPTYQPIDMPHPDSFVFLSPAEKYYSFNVVKNLPTKLHRSVDGSGVISYQYNGSAIDFVLRRPGGATIEIEKDPGDGVPLAFSDDGRWFILHAPGVGLLRVDVVSETVRRISSMAASYEAGSRDSSTFHFDIS